MIHKNNRPIRSIAKELGIHPGIISRWRKELRTNEEDAFPGKGNQKRKEAEIRRLKRELSDIKEERDILKKAAAFFVKHPE